MNRLDRGHLRLQSVCSKLYSGYEQSQRYCLKRRRKIRPNLSSHLHCIDGLAESSPKHGSTALQNPSYTIERRYRSTSSSQTEIQEAYRRMARKTHPDAGGGQESREEFEALNAAYQVLSDPGKRSTYDQVGAHQHRDLLCPRSRGGPRQEYRCASMVWPCTVSISGEEVTQLSMRCP